MGHQPVRAIKCHAWAAALLVLYGLAPGTAKSSQAPQRKPNIVVIYVDDVGFADFGVQGGRFGPQRAIIRDGWKLVQGYDYGVPDQSNDSVAFIRVTPPLLFHLAEDPGETTDLAARHPERVQALDAEWQAWNREQAPPLWLPMGTRPR